MINNASTALFFYDLFPFRSGFYLPFFVMMSPKRRFMFLSSYVASSKDV